MKNLILIFSIMMISVSALALQDKDINLQGGVGVFGSRGIVGFSVDRFYSPHDAISIAFGVDFVGATTTVGYKYFGDKFNTSGTFWDKCLFLFECDSHNYGGLSLQYASKTTMTLTENQQQRIYELDPKWFGLASVGIRDVFKNHITLDTELSYRYILSGGKSVQTSGLAADDRTLIEMGYRTVGFNIALGYLF